jgi:hypothetical protein
MAVSFVAENDESQVLKIEERTTVRPLSERCVPILESVATRLVEMEPPEEKVLERLNKVSTAKRQADMVSGLQIYDSNELYRSYATRSSGKGSGLTKQRLQRDGALVCPDSKLCSVLLAARGTKAGVENIWGQTPLHLLLPVGGYSGQDGPRYAASTCVKLQYKNQTSARRRCM